MLGLMLVASLADVCQTVGITAALEDLGQIEVERVLQRFADEGWDDKSHSTKPLSQSGEDFGEVVLRADLPKADDSAVSIKRERSEAAIAVPNKTVKHTDDGQKAPSVSGVTKKKRRKKGDAIDDLFSGMG